MSSLGMLAWDPMLNAYARPPLIKSSHALYLKLFSAHSPNISMDYLFYLLKRMTLNWTFQT